MQASTSMILAGHLSAATPAPGASTGTAATDGANELFGMLYSKLNHGFASRPQLGAHGGANQPQGRLDEEEAAKLAMLEGFQLSVMRPPANPLSGQVTSSLGSTQDKVLDHAYETKANQAKAIQHAHSSVTTNRHSASAIPDQGASSYGQAEESQSPHIAMTAQQQPQAAAYQPQAGRADNGQLARAEMSAEAESNTPSQTEATANQPAGNQANGNSTGGNGASQQQQQAPAAAPAQAPVNPSGVAAEFNQLVKPITGSAPNTALKLDATLQALQTPGAVTKPQQLEGQAVQKAGVSLRQALETQTNLKVSDVQYQPDKQQLVMNLHPKNMGDIRVQLQSQGDQRISARFIVTRPEAIDELQSQIEALTDNLAEQGIKLEQLHIVHSAEPANDAQNQADGEPNAHLADEQAGNQADQQPGQGEPEASMAELHRALTRPTVPHSTARPQQQPGQFKQAEREIENLDGHYSHLA